MSPNEVKLTAGQKEKLLRNIWLLHDGRWFLKSVEQFGFDTATKLNLAVVKSIAKTEIKQLLAETGFGEVRNIEDLKTLMEIASPLYFPEEHKYEFKVVDEDTFVGHGLEWFPCAKLGASRESLLIIKTPVTESKLCRTLVNVCGSCLTHHLI